MTDIPVYLVGAAGTPDADNPHCSPCITCALHHEASETYEGGLLGMLDSGAFPNAIDYGVWQRLNLPIVGKDTLHTVSGVQEIYICEGRLLIGALDTTIPIQERFSISPMRQNGHMCDLILGRRILTLFDFGYSVADGWYLRTPDDPAHRG
ncbi:MAG: hypothetical protein M9945_12480 [Aquamicrobium sp.]|uniref:hypothetical protein n=1 Tax=Aquamicrobium sp. TaxID=1872579 RepID=UPI00349E7FD9|nr:hypothetical protein [Aquamicrobium sp.]